MNKEITDINKAWMAGFIDGEGCLSIYKQIRKNRPSPSWRPFVTIANTHRGCLNIFVENYGGHIRFNSEKRSNKKTGVKWSDSWSWYCPQSSILKLCNDLMPYFVIKKENAQILTTFITHVHNTKRKKGGRRQNGTFSGSDPLSKSDMVFRDSMRDRIQDINSCKKYKYV